ncbi:MAG: NAD(P)H-hydrate epimerase [Proteobacteria bacterium]|nr:NAD(P)H-hydrate epimerase [Pseudomonadota bacterium]
MIWSSQTARENDRLSSVDYGIPSLDLMNEAAALLAQWAMALWKPGDQFLILAGPGNNGGDALAAARYLKLKGFAPTVLDIRSLDSIESPDRKIQRELYEALGQVPLLYSENLDLSPWQTQCFIIDGILGLGLRKALRPGFYWNCLKRMAELKARCVLAIDFPSGLLADSWQQELPPLKASHCLSFGAAKPSQILEPSRSFCGELRIAPLAFHPEAIHRSEDSAEFLLIHDRLRLPHQNPWRNLPASAHKFTRGLVLVIGGSSGKLGAPLMSARASLRAGAGWASVALLSQEYCPALPAQLSYENLGNEAGIHLEKLQILLDQRPIKALIIGPGTTRNPLSPALLHELQKRQEDTGMFLIFDAAALHDWARLAKSCRFDPDRTLLTPHPGEWRKIGKFAEELGALDQLPKAWDFCQEYGVSVFYKSASPFSLSLGQRPSLMVNTDGNQALAKAGSGDILAGIAAAFGCAGINAKEVGNWAQRCLSHSAHIASLSLSRDGLDPEDLLQSIPIALRNSQLGAVKVSQHT